MSLAEAARTWEWAGDSVRGDSKAASKLRWQSRRLQTRCSGYLATRQRKGRCYWSPKRCSHSQGKRDTRHPVTGSAFDKCVWLSVTGQDADLVNRDRIGAHRCA